MHLGLWRWIWSDPGGAVRLALPVAPLRRTDGKHGMNYYGYLIVKYTPAGNGRCGVKPAVRVAKNAPRLDANEIALKLKLELPDELFKRPQLEASITVPRDAVTPAVVSAEVGDNIREVVRQQLGIDLTIQMVEPKGVKDAAE